VAEDLIKPDTGATDGPKTGGGKPKQPDHRAPKLKLPADSERQVRIGGGGRIPGTSAPVVPVALIGLGLYLAWFGIHYWRSDVKWPSDPIKALLTGKPLPDNAAVRPSLAELTTPVAPLAPGVVGTAEGVAAATAAQKYNGAGYVYGGNASVIGKWDCSSFVSKVLGEDMGLVLPGGGRWGDPGYPPHAHGPGSTQFMLYGTGVDLADIMPGDLIVSVEHIGICIGGGRMISARSPSLGTGIGTFPGGFPAGPPVYRRPPFPSQIKSAQGTAPADLHA